MEQFATIDLVDIGICLTESTWTVNLYLINYIQSYSSVYFYITCRSHTPIQTSLSKANSSAWNLQPACTVSSQPAFSISTPFPVIMATGYLTIMVWKVCKNQKVSRPHEIADWHHYLSIVWRYSQTSQFQFQLLRLRLACIAAPSRSVARHARYRIRWRHRGRNPIRKCQWQHLVVV